MAEEKEVKEPQVEEQPASPEEPEAPSTIKVGNEEYTEEELAGLVGLGKIAKESEEKYNRPISKFWPEYTKAQQKLSEYEEAQRSSQESEQQRIAQTPQEELTPEQLQQRALAEADKLGLIHSGNIQQQVANVIEGYRLLDAVDEVIDTAQSDGNPAVSREDLLNYMRDEGIKRPQVAYELMFKDQLKEIEQKKVKSIKPEGMKTQETTSAGSEKTPEPKSPTNRADLERVLKGRFGGKA